MATAVAMVFVLGVKRKPTGNKTKQKRKQAPPFAHGTHNIYLMVAATGAGKGVTLVVYRIAAYACQNLFCPCGTSVFTNSFTPPMALLTIGSVSMVRLSAMYTFMPSASRRPFVIIASDEYW
jgi:hypothetical protein